MFMADIMAAVFPNVRFLCVKGDVNDTALRIYQRRYSIGNIYSYDFRTARDHIIRYHEAIDLLQEKLPEWVCGSLRRHDRQPGKHLAHRSTSLRFAHHGAAAAADG